MSLYEIIRLIPDLNLCIFTQIGEFPYLGRLYSCIKSNKTHISKFVIYDEKYDSTSGNIFGILRESNLIMGTTTNKDDAGHIIICDNGINFSVQCECYKIYDCFGPNTAFMVTTKLGNIFTVESKYHLDIEVIDKMSVFKSYIHQYCTSDVCTNYSMISELAILYHVIVCTTTAKLIISCEIGLLTPDYMFKLLKDTKISNIIIDISTKIYTKTPIRNDICYTCNNRFYKKLSTCMSCKKFWYCSKKCQKIHWNLMHKYQCNKVSDTSSECDNKINKLYDKYAILFRHLLELFIENMANVINDTVEESPEISDLD